MPETYLLRYTARGTTYTLNGFDLSAGFTFYYLGDQNFGMSPVRRITVRGPLQNGDSDIDYRLDPRILQLPFVIENTGDVDGQEKWTSYSIREKLLGIFRPNDRGVLRITTSDATGSNIIDRSISVTVLGGLSFDVDPTEYHVRFVLQLRADDPTWYNPTKSSFTYDPAFIGSFRTINAGGNWFAFPSLIRINGPITNPLINNATTGQSIQINATIAAGAFYNLNLSYGVKTVTDNTGANRIATVDPTTDLAVWSFAPGNNVIAINGTGTTTASTILFEWNTRYIGV